MIRLRPSPVRPHGAPDYVFVCDVCGAVIERRGEVRLVREACALPEERAVFHMHRACVGRFMLQRTGRWDPYPLASPEAAWLL